jgi:hypothetical protein
VASGDEFRFEGTFRKVNEAAQQAFDELTQLAAMAREGGDEVRAGLLEHQAQLARGNVVGGTGAAGQPGAAGAEALARANAERERAVRLDREDAAALAAQRDALVEQYQLRERLQRGEAPQLFVPPTGPQYGPREATAGGQAAAEAAARQQAAIEALAAGGVDEAMLGRLRAASIVTPEPRGGGAYEQLAAQQAEREAQAKREQQAAEQAILEAEREQAVLEAQRTAEIRQQTRLLLRQRGDAAYQLGGAAAAGFQRPAGKDIAALTKMPQGVDPELWNAQAEKIVKVNSELGMYDSFAANASISTEALSNNLTRLGVADAQASDQLRRHGALTTEFLGALARGETTVSEFGYQIGATIGKFGGWATAAAATYGALGAVFEVGKGALDTSTAVEKLSRTIDNVNPGQANQALQQLSRDTNVSMAEAGDAVFQFSRTFHTVPEATAAARLGLAALKLDNVSLSDSVRASTAISQQFGGGLGTLTNVYNELSAAQREYNARISDMIPLLQKSSGAVANAGGDLTQLIQIGTAATRITQLSGAQVGTALYRSAATFLNPSTTKGAADIQTVRQLGVQVDPHNITQTILNAIRASWTMTPNERSQLANSIFGPQYGGRLSALFNPQQQQLVESITGPGRGGINPQATRGSLQQELSIELHTARESLSSFINELGRLGAAIGGAGVLTDLTFLVRALVDVMGAMRGVVNVFDQLPGPLRDAIAAATAFRLAMLFFSRTRFGSTAPLITRVPGFRPSEATLARGELAIGMRQGLNQLKANLGQTSSRLTAVAAEQVELERMKATYDQRYADSGQRDVAALKRSNAIALEIGALKDEQLALEIKRESQDSAIKSTNAQLVRVTATRRDIRASDSDVLAIRDATAGANTSAAATTAASTASAQNTAAMGALARTKARLASVLRRNAVAEDEAAAEMRGAGAAAGASAAAGATEAGAAALETETTSASLLTRVGGFAKALDPFTLALLALPFAFKALSAGSHQTDKALEQAITAAKAPVTDLQQLNQNITELNKIQARREADRKKVEAQMEKLQHSGGFTNDLNKIGKVSDWWMSVLDKISGVHTTPPKPPPTTTQIAGATERTYANVYNPLFKQAEQDARNVGHTQKQRENWYHQLDLLKAQATQFAVSQGGGTTENVAGFRVFIPAVGQRGREAQRLLQAFNRSIQALYEQIEKSVPVTGGADPLAGYEKLANSEIAKRVQYADDYTKAFGGDTGKSISQAIYAYTALTQNLGKGGLNDADLAKLSTAQSNLTSTISSTVGKLVKGAQDATTAGGAQGNISSAISLIDHARSATERALRAAIAEDHGNAQAIKRARASADTIFRSLNDALATVAAESDTLIQDQTALAQSRVTGSSPEADLSRQQIGLAGLRRELANAQANHGTYDQVTKLQTQIDTAQNDLNKARTDNARNILEARGGVQASAEQGLNPADAIRVARTNVDIARNLLAFDRSHGAGEAQVLQDQKALLDAEYSLNQTIQQRSQQIASDAQQLIQAQAALAESRTLDPVKQAADAIRADTQSLATIKPENYQSTQQYQAALANAQAQRNKDIQAKRDAIINQDMQTLSYEYNTMQIGSQQYINGLERILRTQKMSLQQRQQIEQEIYQLKTTQGQNLDLNVGSIKLPSIYEIRRAIGLGRSGELPGAQGTVINHQASVVVNVYSSSDVAAVGNAIDQQLNTSVRSAMRAKGVVGV